MREVTLEQVIDALQAVGVEAGDGLLVHSAIQFLGRPVENYEGEPIKIYLDALWAVLGPRGTIAVPTFNFGFARGEPYDPASTPSIGMGAFSEYIRQQPDALRTFHPMQSLAVIGRYATDLLFHPALSAVEAPALYSAPVVEAPLSPRDTPSAFEPGSSFERMLELGFKILLLGADVNAISMLHYSEQRIQVPYRYWKEFTAPYKTSSGWQSRTYRMYVRDLETNLHLTLRPVQARLEEMGQWRSTPLNYGRISYCRMVDFVAVVDEFLSSNPLSLIADS